MKELSHTPLISVYIPTHNRSGLLRRAVDSVLNQSYQEVEIIIVDDGSSDDTTKVVQLYLTKHGNIVYLKHDEPKGACAARNYAIAVAKGKYITGLDDDDEFKRDHLAGLYNAFDEKYSFVAACLLEDTGTSQIERSLDCGIIELASLLHYNKVGNQVFTLTSRMREICGFDEKFPAFQDYDTWVRLTAHFGSGKKVHQPTYVWHTSHEQERISNFPTKRLAALQLFTTKHNDIMSQSHKNSLEIMRIRMASEAFPLATCLRLANRGNWKAATALYLNTNLKTVKGLIDRFRL